MTPREFYEKELIRNGYSLPEARRESYENYRWLSFAQRYAASQVEEFAKDAGLVHSVERLPCKQEATGAKPVPGSTCYFPACTIPPEGWWCSRECGHEGPCAARPTSQAFTNYVTDIASDIDPEILNHKPGRCIR